MPSGAISWYALPEGAISWGALPVGRNKRSALRRMQFHPPMKQDSVGRNLLVPPPVGRNKQSALRRMRCYFCLQKTNAYAPWPLVNDLDDVNPLALHLRLHDPVGRNKQRALRRIQTTGIRG